MYKVMVVDDELLARIGIVSLIDWEKNNMELVCECENGKIAYDMATKYKPHIIITDIKMPVMNGIDLIKKLKKEGYKGKFIVLSSHSDFDYVKEAMKLGVEDYILKLKMEADELLNVLENVIKTMVEESRKDEVDMQTYLHSNMRILQEDFMRSLIRGSYDREMDISHKLELLNIGIGIRNLYCITIIIEKKDGIPTINNDEGEGVMGRTIINLIRSSLKEFKSVYVCRMSELEFTVLINNNYNSLGINAHMESLMREIYKYINLRSMTGISGRFSGYENIRNAYKESKEAIKIAFSSPSAVSSYKSNKSEITDAKVLEHCLKQFEEAYSESMRDGIDNSLYELYGILRSKSGLTKEEAKRICFTIVYILKAYSERTHIMEESIFDKQDPYIRINQLFMKEDYLLWIAEVKQKISDCLGEMDNKSQNVIKAKEYIKRNYGKDSLSLKKIADYLYLSPSYLSAIFKSELGINYNDFVTKVRIEKAKELLRITDKKVYTIAEDIGYGNIHYFSRIFKKTTGFTPLQYRNQCKKR